MLVKVNDIEGNYVRVTKLDIDDFGSVIPVRQLDLKIPQDDDSINQTLMHSVYAILFTADEEEEEDGSTIILARSMTLEELNEEKERTVRAIQGKIEANT
ncbi:MAG: hypothetical protein M3270_03935 [Thermoproteota archaeon]|nr:hypothetical protein [Thermoproteota archaeon]